MLKDIRQLSKDIVTLIFITVVLSVSINVIVAYIFSESKPLWILIVALVVFAAILIWVVYFLMRQNQETIVRSFTAAIFYELENQEIVWFDIRQQSSNFWFHALANAWNACKAHEDLFQEFTTKSRFVEDSESLLQPTSKAMSCLTQYGILSVLSDAYCVGWQKSKEQRLRPWRTPQFIFETEGEKIESKTLPEALHTENPLLGLDELERSLHFVLPPDSRIEQASPHGPQQPYGIGIKTKYIDIGIYSPSYSEQLVHQNSKILKYELDMHVVCRSKRRILLGNLISRKTESYIRWAEDLLDEYESSISYDFEYIDRFKPI